MKIITCLAVLTLSISVSSDEVWSEVTQAFISQFLELLIELIQRMLEG